MVELVRAFRHHNFDTSVNISLGNPTRLHWQCLFHFKLAGVINTKVVASNHRTT